MGFSVLKFPARLHTTLHATKHQRGSRHVHLCSAAAAIFESREAPDSLRFHWSLGENWISACCADFCSTRALFCFSPLLLSSSSVCWSAYWNRSHSLKRTSTRHIQVTIYLSIGDSQEKYWQNTGLVTSFSKWV